MPFHTQFHFTGSGVNNYSWDFGDGSTSTQINPAHTYTNSGTYTVTFVVTNTTVCNFPDTAMSVVTVHPLPALLITPPPPYCVGDTVQLNSSSPTAISYIWIPASGLSSTSIANPMASPVATTVYTLSVSDGTCQKKDTVTVHVFPPNITTITTTGQICAGDTVTLTAHGPGISWLWATGQTTSSIDVNQAGSYVVNTLDANGCKGSSSIDIHVFEPVSLATQNAVICEGQLAHIHVNTTPQGSYQYSWNPASSLNGPYGNSPIASPSVTTMYTVTVTNGPCISTDTLKVTVVPLPIIHITTPHYIETFFGEPVEMIAVSNFAVTWVPYDYLSCVTCYTTIATPEQNMTYHAVSVNELGCAAEDTVRIELSSTFFAPNTFTPEGDELNEVWKPVFSGYIQMDVYIYDRWGNQVIHWTDLNGGWDGTFRGKPAQEDVYVYKVVALDFQHKEFHKSGTINLVR
jgi:gliding motility-associated-like protein